MQVKNRVYSMCVKHGSTTYAASKAPSNISMSNIEQILNEFKPDDEIIVICHHGMRSFQVANYLEGQRLY